MGAEVVAGLALAVASRRRRPRPRRNPHAFKPFKAPATPPPGTYDPALDAQLRASQRGYTDLQADTSQTGERSLSDYLLSRGSAIRQQGEGLADLLRSRTAAKQNYQADVTGLNRQTAQLGNRQLQTARAAGVADSGTLAASLAKRQQNYAIAKQPLDVNFQRFNQQSAVSEGRLRAATTRQLGELATGFQRGAVDRATSVARAGRENKLFGTDVGAERFYQAKGTGYVAPTAPKGEYSKYGISYRANAGLPLARRVYTLPSGQRLNRRQWVGYVNKRRRRG